MANEVFANDLEIACKVADGKSVGAFPDPCFTPPSPSAGWILIPYANTAFAKDTENGSRTVFISGKQVMKKDTSYFKTSTGNEPAAGPLGVSTGVKKGKAYFTSWSMNVKIEGQNVDRHTDSMTHNHGSHPSNSPIWKYADTRWGTRDCRTEQDEVKQACAKNERNPIYNEDWKRGNCRFLSFKPTSGGLRGLENPTELLGELKNQIAEADVIGSAISAATDKAIDIATRQIAILIAKGVASKFVPLVGWIYTGLTITEDFRQLTYYQQMLDGARDEAKRIIDDIQNVKEDIEETIESLLEGDFEGAGSKMADWQRTAATANDCLRARKCMLVPYSDTNARSGGMNTSRGCCPGQTGHHLIPHSFVKDSGCDGYGSSRQGNGYNRAPTVCAEGTTQNQGSHGAIHTATTEMSVPSENWGSNQTASASYSDVRDAVIRAHAKTFPFSTCSRSCLREQLDNYYDDCNNLTVKQIGQNPTGSNENGSI